MTAVLVTAASVITQLATAFLAFRLIKTTGRRMAWWFISLSICGMAVRRLITLFRYLSGDEAHQPGLSYELVGLLTSVLMLAGVILISPLFKAMAEEIVRRRKAEAASLESEKKLSGITSNLAEGIYVFDEKGRIVFMNPEAERLFGWTMEELNEKGPHELVHYRKADGSPLPFEECAMHGTIKTGERYLSSDQVFVRKDGTVFPVSVITAPIADGGKTIASVTSFRDISERKQIEKDREKLIAELQEALATIKTLRGIVPICSYCKKIRDDRGRWNPLEDYIHKHTEADFSHGLCPDCLEKYYPDFAKDKDKP